MPVQPVHHEDGGDIGNCALCRARLYTKELGGLELTTKPWFFEEREYITYRCQRCSNAWTMVIDSTQEPVAIGLYRGRFALEEVPRERKRGGTRRRRRQR
jgi:hypothetical protein